MLSLDGPADATSFDVPSKRGGTPVTLSVNASGDTTGSVYEVFITGGGTDVSRVRCCLALLLFPSPATCQVARLPIGDGTTGIWATEIIERSYGP